MRAARFHGAGDVRIEDVEQPGEPGPGEVLLRVLTVGICGSDGLEYRSGPVLIHPLESAHPVTGHLGPLTLGHEFAGEVVAVGPGVRDTREGMLVACGAGMSCGKCKFCRQGRTHLCTTYATIGFHQDGGLAEFCVAPAEICYDAGRYGLGPDAAAMAQPMAIAVHAARRGRVSEGETAVVIGAGGIGCFLTYVVSQWGAKAIVSDLDEDRLKIASALGAFRTVAAGRGENLEDALAEAGLVPDVIFEVSGAETALTQAIALAPRGGRVVAVGVQKAPPTLDMRRVTLDELDVIGTVAHAVHSDFPEALRLIAQRRSGWADTAPEVLPLDVLVEEGIRPLAEGGSSRIKTLIDPWAHGRRPAETVPSEPVKT
jgi:(R,R)-butanediol dehydrogenase / meso-butanediol dehydrogenase / diacetyl reductase